MKLSKLIDNKCSACGGADLLLAKDTVSYSPVTVQDGKLVASYSHDEPSTADDAVRLFCTACGEYFEVPEELA